jgi:hypothetical protein
MDENPHTFFYRYPVLYCNVQLPFYILPAFPSDHQEKYGTGKNLDKKIIVDKKNEIWWELGK